MATGSLTERLEAWRAAERRWEGSDAGEDLRARALEVVAAWVAYQDVALPRDSSEFMLIADDDGMYVGATAAVERVLGYRPDELLGRTVADIAAPELRATTPPQWTAFLASGRQDGSFRLTAANGKLVELRFQARAHHPVPGFHMSRLWRPAGQ